MRNHQQMHGGYEMIQKLTVSVLDNKVITDVFANFILLHHALITLHDRAGTALFSYEMYLVWLSSLNGR